MKNRSGKLAIVSALSGLCLCVSSSVLSQEQTTAGESGPTAKFGIKGGVSFTNLYVDNVKNENMRVGWNAGVYAKLPVTKGFSLQPELLYTTKGSKLTYNNVLLGNGEYRFNLNYLELPVLAVVNVGKNFNIHAGPYVAYLTSANITNKDNNDQTTRTVTSLKADNFNRFDYGLAGGLGIDLQNVTIGARYNYGLREVGKSGSISGEATKNSKNNGISVYLGFGF